MGGGGGGSRLNRYNCITLIMKTGDSGSLKAGPEFWIFMGGGGEYV